MRKRITRMYAARVSKGLTQIDVAVHIGVTQPKISAWENGIVPIPDGRKVDLSELLGVPADELDADAFARP